MQLTEKARAIIHLTGLPSRDQRVAFWVLFILAIAMIFPALGRAGLENWDESIYASISREIARTGDFIRLKFAGQPYMNKPPLYMLLTVLAYKLFGISEFSARFFAAAFGVGNVLLGYVLIRRLFGNRVAFLTGIFLLSSYHFLKVTRHGRMESMSAFFILLALYALVRWKEDGRWAYLYFGSIALGVLTKGPMGVIPLLIAAAYLLFDRDLRRKMITIHLAGSSLLCVLLTVPWFYSQYHVYGEAYIKHFFGYEIYERTRTAIEGHQGSLFDYYRYMGPLSLFMGRHLASGCRI